MKSVVLKTLSSVAKIAQYFFYLLTGILIFGDICFLIFHEVVAYILKETGAPYGLMICLTLLAAGILCLYGLIARSCQIILKNLSEEHYFVESNITSCLSLVWFLGLILVLQFVSNLSLKYFSMQHASYLFNGFSSGDYTLTVVFLIIAFASYLVFKKGKATQDDVESIV